MTRPRPKYASVYVTEEQLRLLQEAAARENRTLSNFLLTVGLQHAAELGITAEDEKKPRKRA